jgi:hypothetical protein
MNAQAWGHGELRHDVALPRVVTALMEQLHALRELIAEVGPDLYCARPGRTSGSVGAQVRHTIDHVGALLTARSHGELTYTRRQGGRTVETDPRAAVADIDRLRFELEDLAERTLEQPVRLCVLTHPGAPPTIVTTTLGRELASVLHHTIHHCAIIALLLERFGVPVPERFGYAPGTRLEQAVG